MKYALYSGSRNLYGDMQTSGKSLIANSDVDHVFFLTEGDYDYWLPEGMFTVLDVSGQSFFPSDSPNMGSRYSYLALMRAALALMPELSDVDRVLSLDVDTICCRDVSGAWDMPVDDCYFSASVEPRSCYKNMLYCNTGVALYNLEKLRDGKAREVVDCLNWRRYPNVEQDVLSFLCQGHIHDMPSEYNANGWTRATNVVRVKHYAGITASKWRKEALVREYREMPWDRVLELHGERVARNA